MSDASASLGEGFQVTAYTVSKPIRLAEVQKTLSKATRSYVKDELARIPDKVAERVCRLVAAGIAPSSSASGPDSSNPTGATIRQSPSIFPTPPPPAKSCRTLWRRCTMTC